MDFEHPQAKRQRKKRAPQYETEETSFFADGIQKVYLFVVCGINYSNYRAAINILYTLALLNGKNWFFYAESDLGFGLRV